MQGVPSHLQARVNAALNSPNPAALISYDLLIGNTLYTDRIIEGSFGSSDGPAMELDVELAGLLPREADGADATLIAYVDGVPIVQFTGEVELTSGRVSSKVEALSSWAEMEKIKLDDSYPVADRDAALVAYELLSRAPYRSVITVDEVDIPRVSQEADRAIAAFSTLADALETLMRGAPISYRDTADDGHYAGPRPNLATPGEPVFVFEPARHYDPIEGISVTRRPDEFSEVVAWRENESGHPDILARAPVDSGAPAGVIDDHEIRDEIDPFGAARRLVNELALHYSRGIFDIDLDTLFCHPLLERGDWVVVVEEGIERTALGVFEFTRRYLGFLVSHTGDLPEKTGKIKVEAYLENERRVKVEERRPVRPLNVIPAVGV